MQVYRILSLKLDSQFWKTYHKKGHPRLSPHEAYHLILLVGLQIYFYGKEEDFYPCHDAHLYGHGDFHEHVNRISRLHSSFSCSYRSYQSCCLTQAPGASSAPASRAICPQFSRSRGCTGCSTWRSCRGLKGHSPLLVFGSWGLSSALAGSRLGLLRSSHGVAPSFDLSLMAVGNLV